MTTPQRAATAEPGTATAGDRPRLVPGVELLGEAQGSGFRKPPYLARREDGQVLQLSRLLHLVAEAADGTRDHPAIARFVSERFGRRVSAGNVRVLVDDKLRPLGVLARGDGSAPVLSKPDPLLALRMRKAMVSPRVVRAITTLCYPLFFPPVVVAALVGLAVMDWWLFVEHGVAQSVRQTVMNPALFLGMFALIVVSAFFHECGHATGCRYGGGRPGVMGAGLYLVFPAFYTDVTDAYRLSRGGRLRTDLGGVYFNALFMLGTFAVYLATGFEPLLFLVLVQHIEVAHQFLPFLRLDGYYVLADLVGVPDLFSRIRPILRSLLPGRPADPRVAELKPWVRVVVSVWVLLVIPFLLGNLGLLLVQLPRMVGTGVTSMGKQWATMTTAFGDGDVLTAGIGVVQLAALALPLLGIAYTLARVGSRAGARAWTWSAESAARRVAVVATGVAVAGLLVFAWLPDADRYRPIGPDERGTLPDAVRSTAGRVEPPGIVGDPAGDPAGDSGGESPGPAGTAPDGTPGTGTPTAGTSASTGTTGGTGTADTTGETAGTTGGDTGTDSASPVPSPDASTTTPTPTPSATEAEPTPTETP